VLKSKSGKANKFPLASGSLRAAGPGEHLNETPLLLHPCGNDDLAQHLGFADGGYIRPRLGPTEAALPK
jgi:hypothetical protein